MLSEELSRLRELHDEGALTDEEYEAAKARLLKQPGAMTSQDHPVRQELFGMTPGSYAMAMHLSQYAGVLVPGAGFVVPLGMWLYGKDQSAFVDQHGRSLANFLISYFVYVCIFLALCLMLVGFLLLPLFILFIIFTLIVPVMGAVAAQEGRSYSYPFTIKFF